MKILFIEDDQVEMMKMNRAISKLQAKHQLIWAENGYEALSELMSSTRLPDLIILDLNMPRMNGNEFLKSIKQSEVFKYIPVAVLTTSQNREDMVDCYTTGIAGYIVKPLKYEDYVKKIDKILAYWEVNAIVPA
ncbi:response regulator receiver domain-containing protein [Flavobacteriaceae bacterium MAR_2009_75]|nr:response regulator receiver domain-containing protein [Flavobacteriaceae bacterium MAR_2009_75]